MLMGEMTNGVMRNYGTDALGSVVETVLNGVEENTYQYKPYGGLVAKTGVAADPSFLWNGGSGYRATSLSFADMYVRRRHYNLSTGLWTARDDFWPSENPFAYCWNRPTKLKDPSGQRVNCCCNVLSPDLKNTNGSQNGNGVGTEIRLSASVKTTKPKPYEVFNNCILHWWEKTNDPSLGGAPINQWYEVDNSNSPGNSPGQNFGVQVPTDCPGSNPRVLVRDFAGVAKNKHAGYSRILCVRAILTWGCYLIPESVTLDVWQLIYFRSSDDPIIYVSDSGPNSKADSYCNSNHGTWSFP